MSTPRLVAVAAMAAYSAVVAFALLAVLTGLPREVAARVAADPDDVTARAGAAGQPVEVEIPEGTSADGIARALAEAGIVRDRETLSVLMQLTGVSAGLQSGRYEFAADMSVSEVLRLLRAGPDLVTMITFRAGLRVEEIGAILEREGIATAEEWQEAVEFPLLPRHEVLLANRPSGSDLTGYLLPGTYVLEDETTALDLLHAMLDSFLEEVHDELVEEAIAQGLTLHELLTLASIVEREAVHPDEEPLVASVFRNRLNIGMALQADPTVQYAVAIDSIDGAESIATYGYWKPELTIWDLEIDSPYNTYLYGGLPPGPIANPGLGAIEASVRPAGTPYLYFVAHPDCDGRHLFAEDLDTHNANVARFRASGCATPGVGEAGPAG